MPRKMTASDLRDGGYLQEANRRFFHPLGLAMFVDLDTNEVGVIDDRDDPEGWVFVGIDLDPHAGKIRQEEHDRYAPRVKKHGWRIQPQNDGELAVVRDQLWECLDLINGPNLSAFPCFVDLKCSFSISSTEDGTEPLVIMRRRWTEDEPPPEPCFSAPKVFFSRTAAWRWMYDFAVASSLMVGSE